MGHPCSKQSNDALAGHRSPHVLRVIGRHALAMSHGEGEATVRRAACPSARRRRGRRMAPGLVVGPPDHPSAARGSHFGCSRAAASDSYHVVAVER